MYLHAESHNEKIVDLESKKSGLGVELVELSAKTEAQRAALKQKIEREKESNALEKKTATPARAFLQSLTTNAASLLFKREISEKSRNDSEFMRDGPKAKEAFLAVPSSILMK